MALRKQKAVVIFISTEAAKVGVLSRLHHQRYNPMEAGNSRLTYRQHVTYSTQSIIPLVGVGSTLTAEGTANLGHSC